jgi:hypothetical protein
MDDDDDDGVVVVVVVVAVVSEMRVGVVEMSLPRFSQTGPR